MKLSGTIVGLLSFILAVVLSLSPFDAAVASLDPILDDKAQQAQPDFLAKLATLVNIDSGTGDQEGLTKVETLVIEYLESIGAAIQIVNATPSVGRNMIATL